MLDQPGTGAGEFQPGQERIGLILVRGGLPVVQILLELLLADQKHPLCIEPLLEPRPFAQERLVRHFDHARVALLAQGQQTRICETLQERARFGGERIESRRA